MTKLAGFEFTKYVIYADEGKIIALRGLNVKNRKLVLDDVKYIDQSDFSKLNRSKLFKNDILFTYVGTVGELAVVPENEKYYLAPNVARIRLNDNVSSQFVSQMMGNKIFYDKVVFPLIATSSQPALSMENVRKFTLKLPSIEEQTKIGNFLMQLDDTVTLHQRKLEVLKQLKQAYLQNMFPPNGESIPRVRFTNFIELWEQRKLGEVAEFNPKSNLPNEFEYVDLESVIGTNLVSHRIEKKSTAPSRAQRLAQKGDVFYQTVRPYQKNNYLFDLPYDNFVFSTGYAQMRPNIDSYFLLNHIQGEKFVKLVLDRCTGTSYPAINSTDLANVNIQVPTKLDEQIKIGKFFKALDNLITLHQQKLKQLHKLKEAYLQKMFI